MVPLMLTALFGAVLHASAGHLGESALLFGLFAVVLQSSYVAAAAIRTLLLRISATARAPEGETDADEWELRSAPRRLSRVVAKS